MLPLWTALLIAPFAIPFVPVDLSQSGNPENVFWREGFGPRGTDGFVFTIIASGSEVILAGGFHTAGSTAANNVALWDNDTHTWSSLGDASNNGVNNTVLGLARVGEDVFLAGGFSNAGGVPARGVAWWNRSTGAWRGLSSGVDGRPWAVAADQRDVFVGGQMGHAGGVTTGPVARWDRATETWNALGGNLSYNGSEMYLACTDDFLYVSGYCLVVNGIYCSSLLRWNRSSHVWSQLPGYFGGQVRMDVLPGGKLVLMNSSQVLVWDEASETMTDLQFPYEPTLYLPRSVHAVSENEIYAQQLHLWRWDGAVWTQQGDIEEVYDITTCQGNVFAGGTFESIGETGALHIARYDGTQWYALGDIDQNGTGGGLTGSNGSVLTLVSNGQLLYAAGDFGVAGDVVARKIAVWDGHSWSGLGKGITDPDGYVWIVVPYGQDVYVGGYFYSVDGMPANHVARWNTVDQTWHPLGSGISGSSEDGPYVDGMLVVGKDLYVAGDFTKAGDITAHSIAKWDLVKQEWSSLAEGTSDGVDGWTGAMVAVDEELFITGGFTRIGSKPSTLRHTIARWNMNAHTWSYLRDGVRDDVNGIPYWILQRDSTLYVCGRFQSAGGVPANSVARYDLSQNTWSPMPGFSALNSFYAVYSMLFYGGDLVMGGEPIRPPDGKPANGLIRWSADKGWRMFGDGVRSTNTSRPAEVFAITAMGPGLYFGGAFDRAGDKVAVNVARWERSHDFERVHVEPSATPLAEFVLRQNAPNPVSGATRISFHTRIAGQTRLRVLDLAGREVARPIDGWIERGEHALQWQGTSLSGERLPPGVYIYRLETPDGVLARKLVMAR